MILGGFVMKQPKWHEYMLPVMEYLKDGNSRTRWEIIDAVAASTKLTPALMAERNPAGDLRYANRIGWAITYLKQSGLVDSPSRANFQISDEGKKLMATNPKNLTEKDLKKYPKYQEFMKRTRKKEDETTSTESSSTPEELVDSAVQDIKDSVCEELLEKVRNVRPDTFETLVIELIKKMGYGDENDPMSGIRIGGAGDGGIDGVVKKDVLGLDTVYIQAKRYKSSNNVDPHDVRDFIGALATHGARKGIFITSSSFTPQGEKHAKDAGANGYIVVLIDGKKLADLMYEHGVGVSNKKTIVLKKLDSDAFEE